MDELEAGGKTVDEAIEQALDNLGLDRSEVEIDIVSHGKSGIFGFGSEEARVRVRRRTESADKSENMNAATGEDADEEVDVSSLSRQVLSSILDLMGITADIDVRQQTDGDRVLLDVSGDDLGILIGRRGDTLASLQYVVNLIVSRRLKVNAGVTVDVERYRERRYDSLRKLAVKIAAEVSSTTRPVSLEPMPSNERRIVHIALRDNPEVFTQSVGHGEGRKVVVLPKEAESAA